MFCIWIWKTVTTSEKSKSVGRIAHRVMVVSFKYLRLLPFEWSHFWPCLLQYPDVVIFQPYPFCRGMIIIVNLQWPQCWQKEIKIIIIAIFLCPVQWSNVRRRRGIADCGKYTSICNNVFFRTVVYSLNTNSTVFTLCYILWEIHSDLQQCLLSYCCVLFKYQ